MTEPVMDSSDYADVESGSSLIKSEDMEESIEEKNGYGMSRAEELMISNIKEEEEEEGGERQSEEVLREDRVKTEEICTFEWGHEELDERFSNSNQTERWLSEKGIPEEEAGSLPPGMSCLRKQAGALSPGPSALSCIKEYVGKGLHPSQLQHSDNMEQADQLRGQAVRGCGGEGERFGRGQGPLHRGGRGPRQRGGHRPQQRGGHGPRQRGGSGGRGQGQGPRQRQSQQRVSNEIRAMVVDHVINWGMTMSEAAAMIQLRRSTVASIIRTFRNENRSETRPNGGGRGRILTDQQELAVVNLVRARNEIRLTEIQQHIIDNVDLFNNVEAISLPTIACILKRNQVSLKQIYQVPFERNTERVKQLRAEYVQRVIELDAAEDYHKFLYIDEAGFNLAKTWRRGQNLIGQRATIQVPGQRGGNITMCAAISEDGVVARRPVLGSYNAALLQDFLNELEQLCQTEGVTYVVVWDNVRFHHAEVVHTWFEAHPQFIVLYLPPYAPFLNPIEEFFSAWRWKVYDRRPHERATLLQAMDDACNEITADQCQAWIRHARRFSPQCLPRENIHCDVDENLWPTPEERVDANDE